MSKENPLIHLLQSNLRQRIAMVSTVPGLLFVFWWRNRKKLQFTLAENLVNPETVFSTIKLKKRFYRGAVLGYFVSKYLLSGETRMTVSQHINNAEILAYWFLTIIAADNYLDSRCTSDAAAKQFLEQCLKTISGREILTSERKVSPNYSSGFPLNDMKMITINLCNLLHEKVQKWRGICEEQLLIEKEVLNKSQNEFARKTDSLFAGQLLSLKQFELNEKYNWRWYYKDVINQKGVNGFLAPLSLFKISPHSSQSYTILETSFLFLNSAYFHWQLIDDITDLEADTSLGLISAPGYLLISQGQLAERLLPFSVKGEDSNSESSLFSDISAYISESCLLEDYNEQNFSNTFLFKSFQKDTGRTDDEGEKTENLRALAKKAIANDFIDFSMTLGELCERRIQHKASYIDAMRTFNKNLALKSISESKVSKRIINIIEIKKRVVYFQSKLKNLDDPYLISSLRMINEAMNRTYILAKQITNA